VRIFYGVILVAISVLVLFGLVMDFKTYADLAYVGAHPAPTPTPRIVFRDPEIHFGCSFNGQHLAEGQALYNGGRITFCDTIKWHVSDDVATIFAKAARYCKGHGGVGFINLFPDVPNNWGVACNNKDAYFSDAGLLLESKSP